MSDRGRGVVGQAEVGERTHLTDVLLSDAPFTLFLPIVFWLRCFRRAYLHGLIDGQSRLEREQGRR